MLAAEVEALDTLELELDRADQAEADLEKIQTDQHLLLEPLELTD
jgi:hypothetical protein